MGVAGLEPGPKTQEKQGVAEQAVRNAVQSPAEAADLPDLLRMLDRLPLTPDEKAEAVRRLLAGRPAGAAPADGSSGAVEAAR